MKATDWRKSLTTRLFCRHRRANLTHVRIHSEFCKFRPFVFNMNIQIVLIFRDRVGSQLIASRRLVVSQLIASRRFTVKPTHS